MATMFNLRVSKAIGLFNSVDQQQEHILPPGSGKRKHKKEQY